MLKILNVALLFCLLPTSIIYAKVELTHLIDSIYISEDYLYAKENSVVYIGESYVSVIGATWTPQTAKLLHEEIKKRTHLPVTEVVDTNYHPDRSGGNLYWQSIGCEIHSTQKTYDLIKSDWQSICNWTRNALKDYPIVPCVLPTQTHHGSFQLQQNKIQVIYLGESHTKDGVFVYFPNEKVLYGGCILKNFLGNVEHANLKEYPHTLNKLKKLNLAITHIIAGHGKPIHGPELIDQYLGFLSEL